MRRYDGLDDHRDASGTGRRARSLIALLAVSSIAAGAALADVATGADAETTQAAVAELDGLGAASAGASCWEIKQRHPASSDGVYWLQPTPLERPGQFYCDMTTDGGGWVLIGRGREGWTFRDYGQSTPEQLVASVTGPAAFAPAALSSSAIDALLGGGAVKDLPDGLRVRRARNATGTTWQELRWRFLDLEEWSWAFGGGHRLASVTNGTTTRTGSNTKDSTIKVAGEVGTGSRTATNADAWYTYPWSGHGRQAGFSYRGTVSGSNNATSYLWEYANEDQAIPFTQLFLRPRLTTPARTPIPDEGLGAVTLAPLLDDRPAELAGGVRGVLKVGDSEPNLDTPVLAITTLGDRVYVGGKFSDVRDTSTGQLVRHSYLAAFDRSTGAWIPSFRPILDGTVWDLDIVNGRLIVAGQFTNVNGQPSTSAMAALDPVTGAVDPTWRSSFRVTGTTARPFVTSIDVEGDWIYVGGNFTRIQAWGPERAVGRLARVSVANGEPDTVFRPNVDGVPFDLDVTAGIAQVVGNFRGINGAVRQSVGTVDVATGAVVTGLAEPIWTNGSNRYQLAVLNLGAEVWQGGSEHNTSAYRSSDYGLLKTYVTADQGGDSQVLSLHDGKVIQGSHANAFIYRDATTWPNLDNFSRIDIFNWVGMFDAATHEYERDWVPGLGSAYTEGTWALHTDVDGCLWFGGDLLGGPYVNGQRQYLESFSKFCPRDTVAPTTPQNPIATSLPEGGVNVTWTPSTDDRVGFVGYEILRNDRVVSPLVYGRSYVDPTGTGADRYFVRAVDPGGNQSATTPVLIPADNRPPTTPANVRAVLNADQTVTLTWDASTDDVAVVSYRVLRNGAEIALVSGTELTYLVTGLTAGTHSFQVQAIDNAGNESRTSPSADVEVGGADVTRPTVPRDLVVVGDPVTAAVTATWTASTDNVGVVDYVVYRNSVEIGTVPAATTTATIVVGYGNHYIAVAARDAAGNVSARTASTLTAIVPPPAADTQSPSTPTNLSAVVNADGSVDVSWSASRDNVGVTSYRVTRNNAEVAVVPGTQTSARLSGLGYGDHFLQVQAFDAAGNASWKTPSVTATIVPPPAADTQSPSTPTNLSAVVNADGSVDVSWSASRDNVGVTSYRVTRNNAEVAVVAGSETAVRLSGLGYGDHFLQVQAFDAAGNASWKTPSVTATIVPPPAADTQNPSTPTNLVATPQADGTVLVTWTASRDNVGVTAYRITRNNAEVAVVPATETTAVVAGLGPGTHHIQVQAFDAAGNASWKTPSVSAVL